MVLKEMEIRAHRGLDEVMDLKRVESKLKQSDHTDFSVDLFDLAATFANRDFNESDPNAEYIRNNIKCLYVDVKNYVKMYSNVFCWHQPTKIWATNHTQNLQSGRCDFLRLTELPDVYKIAVFGDEYEMIDSGIFELGLTEDDQPGQFQVSWNDHIDWLIRVAPPTKGCPARNMPSQYDPSRTMADYFTERCIHMLGERTVHSLFDISSI